MCQSKRGVRERGHAERRGDHAQRGKPGQLALDDHRSDGVAEGDKAHLADRAEVIGADIESDQSADSEEADSQPNDAA